MALEDENDKQSLITYVAQLEKNVPKLKMLSPNFLVMLKHAATQELVMGRITTKTMLARYVVDYIKKAMFGGN